MTLLEMLKDICREIRDDMRSWNGRVHRLPTEVDEDDDDDLTFPSVNPATGLPLIHGMRVDVLGSPFGCASGDPQFPTRGPHQ